jgi:hypothetical protein
MLTASLLEDLDLNEEITQEATNFASVGRRKFGRGSTTSTETKNSYTEVKPTVKKKKSNRTYGRRETEKKSGCQLTDDGVICTSTKASETKLSVEEDIKNISNTQEFSSSTNNNTEKEPTAS